MSAIRWGTTVYTSSGHLLLHLLYLASYILSICIVIQRLSESRSHLFEHLQRSRSSLFPDVHSLELSMGMSQDFELAVCFQFASICICFFTYSASFSFFRDIFVFIYIILLQLNLFTFKLIIKFYSTFSYLHQDMKDMREIQNIPFPARRFEWAAPWFALERCYLAKEARKRLAFLFICSFFNMIQNYDYYDPIHQIFVISLLSLSNSI